MNKKVSEFVRKYVEEHLDKSDPKQEFEVSTLRAALVIKRSSV